MWIRSMLGICVLCTAGATAHPVVPAVASDATGYRFAVAPQVLYVPSSTTQYRLLVLVRLNRFLPRTRRGPEGEIRLEGDGASDVRTSTLARRRACYSAPFAGDINNNVVTLKNVRAGQVLRVSVFERRSRKDVAVAHVPVRRVSRHEFSNDDALHARLKRMGCFPRARR